MASPNGDGYFFRRSVNFVDTSVKRGDIYYADLSPVVGSEQGGIRPVLIIQNDTGNRYSPTVIAAAITSQTGKARLPTHIALPVNESCGLNRDSIILLEQVYRSFKIIRHEAAAGTDGPCGGAGDGEGGHRHRGELRTAPRPVCIRDRILPPGGRKRPSGGSQETTEVHMKNRWALRLAALTLISCLAMSGVSLAVEPGSATDPLVTLSYLNDVFLGQIMTKVDQKITARNSQLLQQSGGAGGMSGVEFAVVTLSKGQVLTGDIGCEVMLRVGTASCVSPSNPGLIDETTAASLNNGSALAANHLYMMTIEGRGVKAGSDTTKLLVRGSYTIA